MERNEKNQERKDAVAFTATQTLAALIKADVQKAEANPKATVKSAIGFAVVLHDCMDEMFNENQESED